MSSSSGKSKVIYHKTDEEIELLRENGALVSKVLAHCASRLAPGVTGLELDKEAEEMIRDHGAEPGFLGMYGYPYTIQVSLNSAVVHGMPTDRPFEDGDIISIDCGTRKHGYYGDSAHTFALGNVPEEHLQLLRVTKTSLELGVDAFRVGRRIGDISYLIQNYIERKNGYRCVRELVGHGLGRSLHEAPEVPNFGKKGKGAKIQEGLVVCVEPMVNMGRKEVYQAEDGWTIFTKDGKPSAHYEYMIAVNKAGADILSDHSVVEEAIKNNKHLNEIDCLLDFS